MYNILIITSMIDMNVNLLALKIEKKFEDILGNGDGEYIPCPTLITIKSI